MNDDCDPFSVAGKPLMNNTKPTDHTLTFFYFSLAETGCFQMTFHFLLIQID